MESIWRPNRAKLRPGLFRENDERNFVAGVARPQLMPQFRLAGNFHPFNFDDFISDLNLPLRPATLDGKPR